jgi:nucleotide-binding universal stress UspA family protein
MSSESLVRSTVVGMDGSAASRAALEWVCRSAATDDVVHAVHVHAGGAAAATAAVQRDLDAWVEASATGETVVRKVATVGECADELLRVVDDVDAQLLAVGRHSGLLPHRPGRTTLQLLEHTRCAIAIVGDEAHAAPSNTVVAGVGHGPATRSALRWAAEYAEAHGTALKLIRAMPNRPVFRSDGLLDVIAWYVDRDMATGWALDDLESAANSVERSTDADLSVSWSASPGSPARVLTEEGASASLLVVGLHQDADAPVGHADHDVPHWLHHAITHAPCPVVVVPLTG